MNNLVFGAGTVQWSWALDSHHDRPTGEQGWVENQYDIRVNHDLNGAPEIDLMQATVNLFADMGNVQPQTLLKRSYKGLNYATQWVDTDPPSEISIQDIHISENGVKNIHILFRGKDEKGIISGVEVKLSKDDRWHPSLTLDEEHFLYTTTVPNGVQIVEIFYRGVDDSSNIGPTNYERFEVSKMFRKGRDEL